MESFTNSCRLCLWKGDKMIPIFTSPDDDETASKIRKCLPLDVRWEDSLPKGICASCLYKVETLYEFNCSAVRVDSLLRKYLPSEIKDGTIKEQQLNSSDYEVSGMRSVAVGTDDEYVPSARIRECRDSSTDTEPFVGRVRVRTPFDLSDVNSVGTSPMVMLSSEGCSAAVVLRSDSAQSGDSGSGVTEQAALSRGAFQREDAGQRTPSQGEARAGTDVVCISVKSSPNVTQNDLSTPDPCKCSDDDDVVVLAEIQKPAQPNRRCKTRRLCAQHLQLRMQQEQQLQQQGPLQPGTQSGPAQPPPIASDRVPAVGTSSSCLAPPDASTRVPAGRDPSPGAGARHLAPETPSVGTSSYSTEPVGHVHSAAQCRQICGATSSLAARASSELSHSAPRPGQPEQECSSAKCNSSVPELLDGATQTTPIHPRGTTVECLQTKSCGNSSSSSEALPPAAAPARLPPVPPAAPLRALLATPAVRPPSPSATPIHAPPSSVLPTPSSNLIRTSAALPKNPVPSSSDGPPGTPANTQSAVPAVGASSVIQLARFGSTAADSPPPVRSPSGGQSQSSFAAQKRSRSRSTSKSPSGGHDGTSKSPVSATSSRTPAPPTPSPSVTSATRAPPAPASTSTASTWTVSATTATSTKLLRVSAQPQQQETGKQRVLLPAHDSGHPEHTVIQANLQNGVYKINRYVYVPNTTFHAQTQPEQQGNVSQVLPAICPETATAKSLPSATPQTPTVLKEEELKPQLEQTRSPGEAINQLIAASALISPPRGSAEPELRVKKEVKSPGQLTATHLSTAPQPKQHKRKSQVQCEQQKNRKQVPCDKPSEKIGRESAASTVDTGGKGGSVQSRQAVSWADRLLTSSTTGTATSNTVAESSKKKKEHWSQMVHPELLPIPSEDVAASPTSEQLRQIKQKHRTSHSPTYRSLIKSPEVVTRVVKSPTEIAENMKKSSPVARSQLAGGTVEERQAKEPPAFQNSDISQKWKKKKKKKKEKEEEGTRHRSSHKYQHEHPSHKRKHSSRNTRQPGDPPPKPEADHDPQQIQKTETASTGQRQSQMATTTAKFDLSGGEAEQPQVERWRSVQAAAVERVRSAMRERAQPPPPLPSPPPPSAPTKTPPPPVLTPQHPARPVSPTSPSPTPPTLPPAVSATPRTDSPPSGALPRPATPPPGEKSPTAPCLTPHDGADRQKPRSQPTPEAAAEICNRRLRTPSPAASTGSAEWLPAPCRSACSPRRYYNRKRKHSDRSKGETSGADAGGAGDSAERGPRVPPASEVPPRSATARPDPAFAVPRGSLPPRTGRAFRYTCRHCRQRFGAGILLGLHRVNGACEPQRSHDHDYARNRPAVTERELMLAARVRLERVLACPRCHRVLASRHTLRWHLAVRHGRDNPRDTRATLQSRWQDAPSPPPRLLPLAGKATDSKDTMLEALGLTRKA